MGWEEEGKGLEVKITRPITTGKGVGGNNGFNVRRGGKAQRHILDFTALFYKNFINSN